MKQNDKRFDKLKAVLSELKLAENVKPKIRYFFNERSQIYTEENLTCEILFPRYTDTDADRAIALFKKLKVENGGRESNRHKNAYYQYKINHNIRLMVMTL